MSTVEGELLRLRTALCVDSDAQLAEIMGYNRSTVAQWKARGAIPAKAMRRFKTLIENGKRGISMQERRESLGHQVMYEGRCLAIWLAPSLDSVTTQRIPALSYSGTMRQYASFFSEIELACAEEVAARLASLPDGNASDAMASLASEPPGELLSRILARAFDWREGIVDA
jgi:hypothetical protein